MVMVDPAAFLDLLAAREGLICAVGAGGKKSTLYRLIEAHRAIGTPRIGLTATVMTAPPPQRVAPEQLADEPRGLMERVPAAATQHPVLAYGRTSLKPGRLGGLDPSQVARLHELGGFTATLVKADGARMRLIKAPAPDEPLLPSGVATVVALVSVRALGRPLDERVAHRPERVSAVTGAALGEPLTPEHVARLLASEDGALRHVGEATVVPVINMVEGERQRVLGRAVARAALALTRRFERVLLTSMSAPDPILEAVER